MVGAGWAIEHVVTEALLKQVVTTATQEGRVILVTAERADFALPSTPERRAAMAQRVEPLLRAITEAGSGVLRIHVFGLDGTVIFSDLEAKRGTVVPPETKPPLAAAIAGEVAAVVSGLTSSENADLREKHGRALEVYVPLRLDNEIVGVYEVYADMAVMSTVRPIAWTAGASIILLLFLTLRILVKAAAATIQRQQEERVRLLEASATAAAREAERLRDLDKLKDDIISTVSHELRTPMAALVGFAELMSARRLDEPTRAHYLSVIVREGQRLTALLDDFLDLQRLQSGTMSFHSSDSDLGEIVASAVECLPVASTCSIRVDLETSDARVRVDADRIKQVVLNLLSNALKYSPGGGRITVRVARRDDVLEVTVADQGLGIPPELTDKLFERFYRISADGHAGIKGTGLGLMISRRIIEQHGGRIWAESPGPGKGSTFGFVLPVSATEDDASPGEVESAPVGSASPRELAGVR